MAKKASAKRVSWFDEESQELMIAKHAQKLESFLGAVADGQIDLNEITAQEKRIAKLMKEIEPKLDDELHAKVTKLLCEISAYDIMQMLRTAQEARSSTMFRG